MNATNTRVSRILNLGSGNHYEPGKVNVDYFADQVDVRHDLNSRPYPFETDSFDEIQCLNIIEHLGDVIAVMEELHRIGRPGCQVTIRVPHFRSACLYEDITHRHGFAWNTMDVLCGNEKVYGRYTDVRYRMLNRYYTPYKIKPLYDLLSKVPALTDHLLSKYIPMASIVYVMEVVKPTGEAAVPANGRGLHD
jgi:SAM-dependent methyltransferase